MVSLGRGIPWIGPSFTHKYINRRMEPKRPWAVTFCLLVCVLSLHVVLRIGRWLSSRERRVAMRSRSMRCENNSDAFWVSRQQRLVTAFCALSLSSPFLRLRWDPRALISWRQTAEPLRSRFPVSVALAVNLGIYRHAFC